MYTLMSLFIFGQYIHSRVLRQHPSISKWKECSISFRTAHWFKGTITRVPKNNSPSCTVISRGNWNTPSLLGWGVILHLASLLISPAATAAYIGYLWLPFSARIASFYHRDVLCFPHIILLIFTADTMDVGPWKCLRYTSFSPDDITLWHCISAGA